ncbi:hypothetical protein KXD93_22665 [Mucilaginibacter sp. BJC16-A38]|uniref:hypothetical protein n=1 Tax=Mucilaginibacter phenanthrenivorans TaxID=1234842 RepID=UPI002157050B|nr:hypothetical protein [Mucilaginibacter phenanthrenivorans]MCR8560475.1 hypothetical protein [Mucilaginibacter phenanthrenivorans]
MKKILFIIPIILFACTNRQSKQQIAETLVKSYLNGTLNDPHSYESVRFDTLVPYHQSYALGDPVGKKMDLLAASYVDSASKYDPESMDNILNESKHRFHSNIRLKTYYKRKEDSLENIINLQDKTYKGKLQSYSIEHTYRAKNGFGALGLHKSRFQIDTSLSKVTYAEEID